jgi:3-deoxy-7-phosphoheptulonate synthase
MHQPTADLRIRATKLIPAPVVLEQELPLSDAGASLISATRAAVGRVMSGKDDRLLVIVGPCSIHDPAAALEYGEKLQAHTASYTGELLVVMRVYFEKPRTVVGWKGLINDPYRDGTYEITHGLRLARKLMLDLTDRGIAVGTEFLDTTLGQYYAELVSWGAIGARTVESQVHRELASGLSMPVGFKNRTDGDIQVALDAIRSARQPHWFPSLTRDGVPAVMGTTGNDQCHLVLRGGKGRPNFSSDDVAKAVSLLTQQQLPPFVMIDCSHANSGKDADQQCHVAHDLAVRIGQGETAISGVMLESHLHAGRQDEHAKPLVYGQSITDACLSWEQTKPVLADLAAAVRQWRVQRANH